MGAQAAELILSRLADPALPVRRVVLKSTFMHRESCGCTDGAGGGRRPGL
jgi:LacI family transcriptional regulator